MSSTTDACTTLAKPIRLLSSNNRKLSESEGRFSSEEGVGAAAVDT